MKLFNGNKKKSIFIFLTLLVIAIVGITLAYYNNQEDFKNEFTTVEPGVVIHERFDPTDHWLPGEEKSKQVWFSNSGEMDMYLRFFVEVEWKDKGNIDDPEERKLLDKNGNGIITLYWRDSNNSTGEPVELNENISCDLLTPVKDEKTGKIYYYYNKIMKAGEHTEHVLESVKFHQNLSNDGHKHSDYSNVQIDVTIKGETVLANPEAAKDEWEMIVEEKAENKEFITWEKTLK